jgi:glutamyl-tRNA synthetase
MSATKFDGRFAPSPTADLHLGSLRTALVAWLRARSMGGRFFVRIEDLDPDRSKPEFAERQLDDLAMLGLDWDEEPVRQSERLDLYRSAISRLVDGNRAYPCFCTRAEIREAASAPHGPFTEGMYPGICKLLAPGDAQRRIDAGEEYCLRLRAEAVSIGFDDICLGHIERTVDDFVIQRKDGVPAYNVAVIVDDCVQGIGEVVRGADLADSTPRQILLAQLLGHEPPGYMHVPLVLGADKARLAKRHGDVTAGEWLVTRRATAQELVGALASSLGIVPSGGAYRPVDLIDRFDAAALPTEPTIIG